jgi:YD repeat-containing protein
MASEDGGTTTVLLDADGRPTDDPARAVRGETTEYDADGRPIGKTSFFLQEGEIRWLPIGELPFLLWVLAAFVVIWFVIALVLRAT